MTYAKPDGIVASDWLAKHLDDPKVKVIDVTYFHHSLKRDARAEHAAKHIPGAVHFDIDDIKTAGDPRPHMLPSPEVFAAKVGALGIANGDKVVCYDMIGLQTAARAWWMFRIFGHDNVAVLDGGLPKWIAEGRPVTDKPTQIKAASFKAGLRPALVRTLDQLRANLDSKKEQVADARAAGRFQGTEKELWPGRPGHIPRSRNLPFPDLLDPKDKTFLPAEDIKRKFQASGLDLDRPIVASCGSGVTACVVALGAYLVGKDDMPIYDGSWSEWGLREDVPAATGPE
ncbi:MAG: sulfurtransferase [Alphaproteobacteria bacterium]|nr:sulfurtransferase [Alphaproteobacteria bacterium]